ncbi:hypothetical protein [Aliarcobacter butzleri]|uniref:hypothetical protein n=1 Tax=Aliarcobacter butzleri TaxID=28197 RepID=UPI001EDBBCA2|nr:hypothetical protein [Aliarcobacter butzleri]MCG3662531.1 hypothetical protein [Aliarcobacter butzleri]MCT7643456.1 hypothetical protein [Aliarcobacter butzleri]
MEMLIIFWIGMYFLFEIHSFTYKEHFIIEIMFDSLNPFEYTAAEYFRNLFYIFIFFITVPFIALYFSYSWIKDKR